VREKALLERGREKREKNGRETRKEACVRESDTV